MEKTAASRSDTQAAFSEGSRFGSERSKVTASAGRRETELLKHTTGFGDCHECRNLVETIAQAERDLRCVQRAVSLMATFTVLATVGFGYGLALQENFPHGPFRFVAWFIAALGLTSLISLVIFAALWLAYRGKLIGLLLECRRLVTKLLEVRQAELSREPLASESTGRHSSSP